MSAGTVYFIGCVEVDAVKIGYTTNRVYERLNQAQTNCPIKLELLAAFTGSVEIEAELHQRFAHLRLRGEWFKLSGEISEHVSTLSKPAKPPRGYWGQKRNRDKAGLAA